MDKIKRYFTVFIIFGLMLVNLYGNECNYAATKIISASDPMDPRLRIITNSLIESEAIEKSIISRKIIEKEHFSTVANLWPNHKLKEFYLKLIFQ